MESYLKHNVKIHAGLDRLLMDHQIALLDMDFARASRKLAEYEANLLAHMREEERDFLPLYKKAGEAPGAPVVFFTGEHKRMREFLARIKRRLGALRKKPSPERLVALFDLEAAYKALVQHHDRREKNLLYPALDRAARKGIKC